MYNYRVVAVDNYGRENVSDRLIHTGIAEKKDAQTICDILNKQSHQSSWFYKVYGCGEELYVFEP